MMLLMDRNIHEMNEIEGPLMALSLETYPFAPYMTQAHSITNLKDLIQIFYVALITKLQSMMGFKGSHPPCNPKFDGHG